MVGPDQVVGRRLRRGVGGVRGVGCLLVEEAGRSEAPVDLVGRDVEEPEARPRLVAERGDVRPGRLEQLERADDVRLDERPRPLDRAVDVALGGEVQDGRRGVLPEHPADRLPVRDVAQDEGEAGVVRHVGEALEAARVRQLVEHYDAVRRRPEGVTDEVRADEAGPARHEHRFHPRSSAAARARASAGAKDHPRGGAGGQVTRGTRRSRGPRGRGASRGPRRRAWGRPT